MSLAWRSSSVPDGTRSSAEPDSVRLEDGGRVIGVFGLVALGSPVAQIDAMSPKLGAETA